MSIEPGGPQVESDPPARNSRKGPAAFRTIGEASEELGVPQHVLRFWETKFTQLKPLKRAGGRRYYRPEDMALLTRIRDLLYQEGFTIKGARRHLRQKSGTAPEAGEEAAKPESADAEEATPEEAAAATTPTPESEECPQAPSQAMPMTPPAPAPLFDGPAASQEAKDLQGFLREVHRELLDLRRALDRSTVARP